MDNDSDEDVYPPSLLRYSILTVCVRFDQRFALVNCCFVTPPTLELCMCASFSPMDVEPDVPSTSVSSPLSSPAESILDFGDAELIDIAASDSGMSGMSTETEPPTILQDIPPRPDGPVFFHQNLPVFSVSMRTVETEEAMQSVLQCPEQCLSAEIPQMVTENYCFVVDGDNVKVNDITKDDNWWRPTGKPTKYYFSDDLKTFQRVNMILVKGKVISARLATMKSVSMGRSFSLSSHSSPHPPEPKSPGTNSGTPVHRMMLRHRKSEEFREPIFEHGYPRPTPPASPARGGFRQRKTEDPFHSADVAKRPLRASIASQHHSQESRDSSSEHIPEHLHHPSHSAILRSRSTFIQSKVHDPKEGSLESLHHAVESSPSFPLHKITGAGSIRYHKPHESNEVPLEKVYKVTRFYSFWKSCTSFHRIITVIAPLSETNINPQFKRRIFVQYLWRNAKESDKIRVSKEFDPKKAIVRQTVKTADPSMRKRAFHM